MLLDKVAKVEEIRLQERIRLLGDVGTIWMLWKEHNERTFGRETSRTVQQFLQSIGDEAKLWDLAAFRRLRQLFPWSPISIAM
jgi:hypothetical protein